MSFAWRSSKRGWVQTGIRLFSTLFSAAIVVFFLPPAAVNGLTLPRQRLLLLRRDDLLLSDSLENIGSSGESGRK
jgi:hypothetical protein